MSASSVLRKILCAAAVFGMLPAQVLCQKDVKVSESPPNIVLIVIDTLGANQLKAFGGNNSHTPNLDLLAGGGAAFKRAYSPAPWTKPSVASIFSAQLPSIHKVRRIRDKFAPALPTLAERVKALGYHTGGYVSHTLIAPGTGYARGFDSYEIVPYQGKIHDAITSQLVTDSGIQFLKARGQERSEPFFLFLHYFDAHYNYMHHAQFDRTSWYKGALTSGMTFAKFRRAFPKLTADDMRFMLSLHQEEIAYIDHHIGKLFDYLKSHNLWNNTLVVVTADHGEEFGEHGGVGHGRSLYNELIQVPLIFHLPGRIQPGSIDVPVSTVDIAPTLLDLIASALKEPHLQGYSLTPLLNGSSAQFTRPPVFSEVDYNSSFVGAVVGSHKMKLNKKTKQWELYDVVKDALEQHNLVNLDPARADWLRKIIEQYMREHQADTQEPEEFNPELEAEGMDKEAVKQLESLGYL